MLSTHRRNWFTDNRQKPAFFFPDRSAVLHMSVFLFTEPDTDTFSKAIRYHGLSEWHLIVCVWRRRSSLRPWPWSCCCCCCGETSRRRRLMGGFSVWFMFVWRAVAQITQQLTERCWLTGELHGDWQLSSCTETRKAGLRQTIQNVQEGREQWGELCRPEPAERDPIPHQQHMEIHSK